MKDFCPMALRGAFASHPDWEPYSNSPRPPPPTGGQYGTGFIKTRREGMNTAMLCTLLFCNIVTCRFKLHVVNSGINN